MHNPFRAGVTGKSETAYIRLYPNRLAQVNQIEDSGIRIHHAPIRDRIHLFQKFSIIFGKLSA